MPARRSVKYEHFICMPMRASAKRAILLADYFEFYNTERPHLSLGRRTLDTAYFEPDEKRRAA